MTAPLRASHPTVVNVVLGERSYEIIIGRGQLASLGEKIGALRPGAKAAIVTDETVARHHLAATEAALAAAGIGTTSVTVPAGETSKGFPGLARGGHTLTPPPLDPPPPLLHPATAEQLH